MFLRSRRSRNAFTLLILAPAAFAGCGAELPDPAGRVSMNLQDNSDHASLQADLLAGMRSFMSEGGTDYGEAEVRECAAILDSYLIAISVAADASEALECVRETVTKLNELSSRCEDLIETGQRETLCEILIQCGALRGFFSGDEDVTGQWREW